ncbi:DUF2510 domain-containing protein [Schumannella luteola]
MSETPTTPAGWYPDPTGSRAARWWDGTAWTEHVRDPEPAPRAPLASPTSVQPAAAAFAEHRRFDYLGADARPVDRVADTPPPAEGWTWPVILIAMASLGAILVLGVSLALGLDVTVAAVVSGIAGWLTLPLGFVDRAVLRSRGYRGASGWWMLLSTLVFLIVRYASLREDGLRTGGTIGLLFGSAIATGAVSFVFVTPLLLDRVEQQTLDSIESAIEDELQKQNDAVWTAECPDDADLQTTGSTFTCTASDTSGLSIDAVIDVVAPWQLEVTAVRQS